MLKFKQINYYKIDHKKLIVMMFNLYLICFIIGGIFVSLSALGGLDGADFELEIDHDFESDVEIVPYEDEDQEKKSFILWQKFLTILPITSLKFWTFGLCFFGLTGLVFSFLKIVNSQLIIFILSLFVGLTCGISMVTVLRNLRKNQANSLLKSDDLAGLFGVVEVPFNQESKGKISINIQGSMLDCVAVTQEAKEFQKGDKVLIVGRENNKVWVVSQTLLEDE